MNFFKAPLFGRWSAKYQRVAQAEGSGTQYEGGGKGQAVVEKVKGAVARTSMRARVLVAAGILCFLLILAGGKWYTTPAEAVAIINSEPVAQYLHLLVTSPAQSLSTCRLVVSAGANHYPTPNMVAWENTYNASAQPPTSPSIIKIQSVLDFFGMMGPERDNDVVLIPDPEGTVLQLRPDILMERYFEIIRLGQENARKGMVEGDRNTTFHKIIFGASKRCTLEADAPACYVIPQSPLSSSIYGSDTDKILANEKDPNLYVRERYLSTSFVMGELLAVKRLYEKILPELQADPLKATEQNKISRIFGEQEYYRATLRQKTQTKSSTFKHSLALFFGLSSPAPLDPHPTHRKLDLVNGTQYDYNIALDYEGLLSSDSVSLKTMAFISHNSSGPMRAARSEAGVPTGGFIPLSQDINRSVPPFWSRIPVLDGYPFRFGWRDVNLYTNLWSGSVPATFHYSSTPTSKPEEGKDKKKNLVELETENWKKMWFQPYTRQKLNDYVTTPDRQFTTLRGAGVETAWWSIWREKWKFRRSKKWDDKVPEQDRKEWVEWSDVCEPFWGDVLPEVDGKKEAWKIPINDW